MKLIFVTLLIVPFIAGIFSRWQRKEDPDLDQQVLDQLKKAGSDLSKPHNIDFFLYFPTEGLAKEAAKDIEGDVDTVKVELGADKKNWLCFANKRMVPDHDRLVALRKHFNEVASKGNGVYDGWGTEVVK
jgi:Regulator of ribonuclease activity B